MYNLSSHITTYQSAHYSVYCVGGYCLYGQQGCIQYDNTFVTYFPENRHACIYLVVPITVYYIIYALVLVAPLFRYVIGAEWMHVIYFSMRALLSVKLPWKLWVKRLVPNHNNTRQGANCVHNSRDVLYLRPIFQIIFAHLDVTQWRGFPHYCSPVDSHFHGPVMRSFDVSFDVSLNKLLKKQSSYRWCGPLMWREYNVYFC